MRKVILDHSWVLDICNIHNDDFELPNLKQIGYLHATNCCPEIVHRVLYKHKATIVFLQIHGCPGTSIDFTFPKLRMLIFSDAKNANNMIFDGRDPVPLNAPQPAVKQIFGASLMNVRNDVNLPNLHIIEHPLFSVTLGLDWNNCDIDRRKITTVRMSVADLILPNIPFHEIIDEMREQFQNLQVISWLSPWCDFPLSVEEIAGEHLQFDMNTFLPPALETVDLP